MQLNEYHLQLQLDSVFLTLVVKELNENVQL